MAGHDATEAANDEVLEMLRHLWVEAYADACARVDAIEAYVGPRVAGIESDDARADAVGAAHKLAGTLGTFGFPTGSELGRAIERTLEAGQPDDATVLAVAEDLVALRALLTAAAPDTAPDAVEQVAPAAEDRTTGRAIVVGGNRSLVEALRFEAQRRGLTLLPSLADAEQQRGRGRIAIIDIADDALTIADVARAHRAGMIVVVTGVRSDFDLRMALVAAGADLIIDPETNAQQTVQLAIQLRDRLALDPRVAIVDRDPEVASNLAAELAVVGCQSGTLTLGPALGAPPQGIDAVLVGGSMSATSIGDVLATLRADARWDRITLIALRNGDDPYDPRVSLAHADDVVTRTDGPTLIARRVRETARRRQAIVDAAHLTPEIVDIVTLPNPGEARDAAHDVIVVDDDPTIRALLTELLHREGFSVRCLEDGLAAAELLTDPDELHGVAYVLLDVSLPGLDGFGVLRRMEAAGTLTTVPVAMLTARTSDEDVLRAWELGVTDHIPKPFSVPVLTRHLRTMAQRAVTL